MILLTVVCLVFFNQILVSNTQPEEFKLELLQILFRHGDRIPAENEVYETDPYTEYFERIGYGQLTQLGMQREFTIGAMLRQRYDNFLGDYKAGEVYGYSTNFDRTKMSLQLVLAGMYPPSRLTVWSNQIHWTPIPTHHTTGPDFLDVNLNGPCLKNGELLEEAQNTPYIQGLFGKYKNFTKYVSEKTKYVADTPAKVFKLFSNLRSVKSSGLPLPEWCSHQDYKKMEKIVGIYYKALVNSFEVKKYRVGLVVERVIQNIKASEDGSSRMKVYAYSTHDTTVDPFVRLHNFTDLPNSTDFGAAVMVEKVKGSDNKAYVRMSLWTGVTETIIPLRFEKYGYECPFDEYIEMVKPLIPSMEERKCMISPECKV